jgi:hypothetical protein
MEIAGLSEHFDFGAHALAVSQREDGAFAGRQRG